MKANYINITIIGILFLFILSCSEDKIGESQTGSITGTVVEVGTNEPIENARISSQPLTTTVFTDENGKFELDNVPVGEYSVEARKEGFLGGFEPANVVSSDPVNVIFELEVSTADNLPPTTPVLLSPGDNEVLQSIEADFAWDSSDPDDDPLTYSIELRNDINEEVLTFENITDTTFVYSPLTLGAKYFWQVTVTDGINDPVISPVRTFSVINAPVDNRFLFVRNIDGNNVIFSSDEDGNEFQLTSKSKNSYRPRRNVAANRIAYLQTNGSDVDIYTMARDGTDKQKVTSQVQPKGFDLGEINIAWPPTSDMIYFPRFDKLYRINSNGQGLEEVYQTTDGSLISEVDVSENSDIIALKTNNINGYDISIFTIDFDGNVLNNILSGVDGAASGLNLSVTNQLVLYSYDVSGFESADYRRLDSRMFVYDMVDETTTDISDQKENGTNDLEPIFSPNEAEVIFTNTSNDGISQRDVYKVQVDQDDNNVERELLYENAFMPDWE
ncbi:carboxypeptidase regulatory-like domain-containing protein [Marixanthomonas sp. SCSIO 43207]|uniref:carboxypeptidase-like regulatory domain-containing protein n=1 Tax=Marixanthomonas sp. SCSIO 43207 TaxID=2779360 RepID=UPI001CA91809|nr:carboxypeptidase-like regulatory domain-containing protein [Marixanthomonas sp. SCSIO 43207]UAB81303.1 carboxypeptidase regulatory-like domain-containing protein [Marixanthomonas sp. SCSIO 43207]